MIETQHSAMPSSHVSTPSFSLRLADTRLWNSRFLSDEDRIELEKAVGPTRSIHANAELVREGERTDTMFIITEGWACRYTTTRDGSRQLPALLVPGDVGNLDSLLLDRLDYGVRTLTRGTIVTLQRDRALELAAEHPGIGRTFTWLALVENVILSRWAQSLGRRSARERLAHLLCELSVRLDGEHGNTSNFAFPLTQEHLADALGLTPVHLNRTMQALRALGMASTARRTMTLPDVAGLRQMAGFDPLYLHVNPPRELVSG